MNLNKESRCYSRTKDLATPIGKTFGHFISTDPWFKSTVRDVRPLYFRNKKREQDRYLTWK
jgi:D-amino-acid oxidase